MRVIGCDAIAAADLHAAVQDLLAPSRSGAGCKEGQRLLAIHDGGKVAVVIETDPEIQGQTAVYFPIVLRIRRGIEHQHALIKVAGHTVGLYVENRTALRGRLVGCEIQDIIEPEERTILAIGEVVHILKPVHIHPKVKAVRTVRPRDAVVNNKIILYPT